MDDMAKKSGEIRAFVGGGEWNQPLYWKNNDPSLLMTAGITTRQQTKQAEHLIRFGAQQLMTRRRVGLCGSVRERTSPVAGALMWSLLYRGMDVKRPSLLYPLLTYILIIPGQRLVVLYGPNEQYERPIAFIQEAGDLL
jgi:hypothetical protein